MLRGLEGIRAHAGFHLGNSQWICVTEEMINAFSRAIDQREEIQLSDARVEAPPDAMIVAHGFHTLSLVIPLLQDVFVLEDVGVSEHYGVNHLRFSAPVPLNSSVRLSVKLAAAELSDDAVHVSLECTMECDASRDLHRTAIPLSTVHATARTQSADDGYRTVTRGLRVTIWPARMCSISSADLAVARTLCMELDM
jgi:acyl dehydratase